MKTILFLLYLSFTYCQTVYCQKAILVPGYSDTIKFVEEYDTIPVVILYSDTSAILESFIFHDSTLYNLYNKYLPGEIKAIDSRAHGRVYEIVKYKYDFSIKWLFGYEVRSNFKIHEKKYLDGEKNELAKHIIVWNTK